MPSFDLTTAMSIGLLINIILAVMIFLTVRNFPNQAALSMKAWAFGLLLLAASFLLFSGVDSNKSFVLVLLSNIASLTGNSCMSYAITKFLLKDTKRTLLFITSMTLLVFLLNYLLWQSFALTIAINSFSIFLVVSVYVLPLAREIKSNPNITKLILLILGLSIQFILVFRGIEYLFSDKNHWIFTYISFNDLLVLNIAIIGPVIGTFAFMLMHQEKVYQQLTQIATVDGLTQIFNREKIETLAKHRFKQSIENKSPWCLLLLDLDEFKNINDQHGHAAGDKILYESAQLIKRVVGEHIEIGRFGGEEFLIILTEKNILQASALSQKLISAFQNYKFSVKNKTLKVTASIGLAERLSDEKDFSSTFNRADIALYQAKDLGRNQFVIHKI